MPIGVSGAVALGSAVIGAGASLYGSSQASGAAHDASNLQLDMYRQNKATLAPFINTGAAALPNALALAAAGPNGGGPDYLSQAAGMVPGRMTQAELEGTPGYQFDLSQGLKAVQAAAAARGLGVSGASLKGAATYATGLANKTYLDQFNVSQKRFEDMVNLNTGQQTNVKNQFDRLNSLATIGGNAAVGAGTQGTTAAKEAGTFLNSAGLADAAGTSGVQNALSGAANSYLGQRNFDTLMAKYGSGGGSGLGSYGNVSNVASMPAVNGGIIQGYTPSTFVPVTS